MIRRPPRSTLDRSSAASDVYKRQVIVPVSGPVTNPPKIPKNTLIIYKNGKIKTTAIILSLIHISEPTRPY